MSRRSSSTGLSGLWSRLPASLSRTLQVTSGRCGRAELGRRGVFGSGSAGGGDATGACSVRLRRGGWPADGTSGSCKRVGPPRRLHAFSTAPLRVPGGLWCGKGPRRPPSGVDAIRRVSVIVASSVVPFPPGRAVAACPALVKAAYGERDARSRGASWRSLGHGNEARPRS